PLFALLEKLVAARRRDPVVLPATAGVRRFPPSLDVTESLQPMQDRVEHAVCPLHVSSGQISHPLEDGVAVTVVLREDCENHRRGGSGDQVLAEINVQCLPVLSIEALYMAVQCIQKRGLG